ncbi:hypothetical protein [Sneathiella limimaris]|uniref:hypothetical protein n=1 Tax=Sneathiella limimaris TaxID=1964213 RepID=UPI00146BFD9E|nr:hypothetical protein [Sneathiella limimaris]
MRANNKNRLSVFRCLTVVLALAFALNVTSMMWQDEMHESSSSSHIHMTQMQTDDDASSDRKFADHVTECGIASCAISLAKPPAMGTPVRIHVSRFNEFTEQPVSIDQSPDERPPNSLA